MGHACAPACTFNAAHISRDIKKFQKSCTLVSGSSKQVCNGLDG
jgi:Fe-S-cluster-containing hydrogenase component 2